MFEQDLKSCIRPKFIITTDSSRKLPIAGNILNREFQVKELGTVWVSDITYISVNSDWVYLTTVIDLADWQVINWCVSDDMTTANTVVKAGNKAINNKQIGKSLLFILTEEYNIQVINLVIFSNSTRTWHKVWVEKVIFFRTIKHEKLNRYKLSSIEQVRQVVFEYIERRYNRMRIHSSLA